VITPLNALPSPLTVPGHDIINAERAARELDPFACEWVEEASGDPYNLGIADPGQMTVIHQAYSDAPPGEAISSGTFLASHVPNPFQDATSLRFRLARAERAALTVLDASGRAIHRLAHRRFQAGYNQVEWNGRDERGQPVSSGVCFVRLDAGGVTSTRQVVLR